MGSPIVDFTYRGKSGVWESFDSLLEKAHSITKAADCMMDVTHKNGSIAKHQGIPLFRDRIEARINGSFSCKSPIIEQFGDKKMSDGASLQWVDLINANLSQVSPSSDGSYRYKTGDFHVVLSQEDRDTLCSAFFRKLVQSVDPEDVHEEKNARLKAKADILGLLGEIHHASTTLQGALESFGSLGTTSVDTFNSSSTLASPCNGPSHSQTSPPLIDDSAIAGISSGFLDETEESLSNEEPGPVASAFERNERSENSLLLSFNSRKSNPKAFYRNRNGGRWTTPERRDLKEYLRGREDLSWQQKIEGYRRRFGSHRSDDAIMKQARFMGFHPSDGKKSKVVKFKVPPLTVDCSQVETPEACAVNGNCGARTPQSPNALRISDTSASIGEIQPVEAGLGFLVDGPDSHSFGLCRSSDGPLDSGRGGLEQLLN